MPDAHLDATGLRCPLPVLKAQRAMRELAAGEVLSVAATDPGAVADMAAFCAAKGHEMLSSGEADGVFSFEIRKGDTPDDAA